MSSRACFSYALFGPKFPDLNGFRYTLFVLVQSLSFFKKFHMLLLKNYTGLNLLHFLLNQV